MLGPAEMGGEMNRSLAAVLLTAALIASGHGAIAAEKDNDPLWVAMIGGAGEWPTHDTFKSGPSFSIEFNVIKDWLEVEVGTAKLFRGSASEFETEVVFRKPFTLSQTAEVMIGLGPIWSKAKDESWKVGTTFVADFMFWSSPEKKFGWFVEPSYSIVNPGNERSFALSAGLLVGFH
jgi:hypothetical protein